MSGQGGLALSKGDEGASVDRSGGPTEQQLFDILSNRRRRYALYVLVSGEATTIGSLAEQIAAWENDCPVPDVTPAERKRVYTALQQSHLPRLEQAGLITFDDDDGRVHPTDAIHAVDIYLEVVDEEQISWDQYYLGLSAVSVGIVVAVWLRVPPFVSITPLGWLTLVVTLFGVSALVHNYRSSELDGTAEPPDVADRS
jgi:DNA-binding transcriptional ArsR family regulator